MGDVPDTMVKGNLRWSIFNRGLLRLLQIMFMFSAMTSSAAEMLQTLPEFSGDTLKDIKATVATIHNRTLTLEGRCEITVTESNDPLNGSMLDLKSEDIWIYFPGIKPSLFKDRYCVHIVVNGAPLIADQNIRIDQYLQGTMVISHPSTIQPLQVYSMEHVHGATKQLGIYTYHRTSQLGTMDNAIKSFFLKRGYMATFAQNEDGTGQSRVYVADTGDLVIDTLPAALRNNVSFVRVVPWRWTGKKGWTSGTDAATALHCHWQYDWDNVAVSGMDVEYVPMRHNMNWNSYTNINNKQKSTHALGFNEPDRPDQANITVSAALAAWPEMMKSGLRIGSPAPSDAASGLTWLYQFIDSCDARNYRVDFVAVHWYKGGQTAEQFYNWLKGVHVRTRRPVWITEWNNGANWTSAQSGKPTYAQQAATIASMIQMLDTASFVERYSLYEWVEDTRQMFYESPTSLTPAGEIYRDQESPMAYNSHIANLLFEPCISTPIVPHTQIDDGTWQQTAVAEIPAGSTVKFGPHPWSGGTWNWSGPNNFNATTREILLTDIQSEKTGNYIATHTNSTGCKSTMTFTITFEPSSSVVKISPPAQPKLRVKGSSVILINDNDSPGRVYLYTLQGALLYQREIVGKCMQQVATAIPAGTYILKLKYANKGSIYQKVRVD